MPAIERRIYRKLAFCGLADMAGSLRPQQKGHSVAHFGPEMDGHVPTATFRYPQEKYDYISEFYD
jgi:hypothetical protein